MADGQLRVGLVAHGTIVKTDTSIAVITSYLCTAGERGVALVKTVGCSTSGDHLLTSTNAIAFQTSGVVTGIGTGSQFSADDVGTSTLGTPTIEIAFNEGDDLTLEVRVTPANTSSQRWTADIEILSAEEGY